MTGLGKEGNHKSPFSPYESAANPISLESPPEAHPSESSPRPPLTRTSLPRLQGQRLVLNTRGVLCELRLNRFMPHRLPHFVDEGTEEWGVRWPAHGRPAVQQSLYSTPPPTPEPTFSTNTQHHVIFCMSAVHQALH